MKVKLIAITQPLHSTYRSTLEMDDLDEFIEYCGRVSHRSESKGDPQGFIAARIADGHESILEHASATFELSEISRVCSHQLVRYRLASYTQESQRCTIPEGCAIPTTIANDDGLGDLYKSVIAVCAQTYEHLVDSGIKPEDARYVLPQAITTRMVVTMNFRELRHFFKQRITEEAQREIRCLAICMLLLVNSHTSTFDDIYSEKSRSFGSDFNFAEECLGLSH